MPREFDELRPESLPPSLNAPRARASALSELTGGRPIGQVDILGEFKRTRGPGALARALDRDLAPMFDPYGRDQMIYENRAGAAFGVPARGMFRRGQAFQGSEFPIGELGTPEGVYDAGSGRPVIGAPQTPQPDPGYDHLSPFIEQQLRRNQRLPHRQFGGKVDAGEAVIAGEAGAETFVPLNKRPQLPKGFRWDDQPVVPLQERPQLPKGFHWDDEPPAPPAKAGMLERAGEAIRSTLMGAPPAPPEAPQVPGQPQPPAPAAHPMAPPGGALPPVMMPSPGPQVAAPFQSPMAPPGGAPPPVMMPSPGAQEPPPYRSPMAPPGGVEPPVPRVLQPPLPRAPQGPPAGFRQPQVVQDRSGRWYITDEAGNLVPLPFNPVGGANGNAVE
jgi:hypothetical protein